MTDRLVSLYHERQFNRLAAVHCGQRHAGQLVSSDALGSGPLPGKFCARSLVMVDLVIGWFFYLILFRTVRTLHRVSFISTNPMRTNAPFPSSFPGHRELSAPIVDNSAIVLEEIAVLVQIRRMTCRNHDVDVVSLLMKHLPIEPDNRLNMAQLPFIAKLTATVQRSVRQTSCAVLRAVSGQCHHSASHLPLMPAAAGATFTSRL